MEGWQIVVALTVLIVFILVLVVLGVYVLGVINDDNDDGEWLSASSAPRLQRRGQEQRGWGIGFGNDRLRFGMGSEDNSRPSRQPFIGVNPVAGPTIPGITDQVQNADGPVWFR